MAVEDNKALVRRSLSTSWASSIARLSADLVVVSETTIPRQIRGLNAHCVDERRLFRADIVTPGSAARSGSC
jgi:hypothetical protein